MLRKVETGALRPTPPKMTLNDLLDLYLDGLDADARLSAKTRFDYRHYVADYVHPMLGRLKIADVTPDAILAWQRRLAKEGGTKAGKPLAPNTIRLARAPLSGALKLGVSLGLLGLNPAAAVQRPRAGRSIPRHPTYPVWAFLLGSGLRIGELVSLRWPSVDLSGRRVRVVEFVSTLGYDLVPSTGKSRDAVRTIDLDDGLVRVLKLARKQQAQERLNAALYKDTGHVFTVPAGGAYHPQHLSRMLGRYTVELSLPRLTAHGLRHTSATLMLASGVPPKVAAERLGHADPTLFTNLYSHVTPTMRREAADRIGAALFGMPRQ